MQTISKHISAGIFAGVFCLAIAGCSSGQSFESNRTESNAQTTPETYRPSELTIPSQDSYEYLTMGLKFTLPKSLSEQMDQKNIAMLDDSAYNDDGSAINYGLITWNSMTEEQRNAQVENKGNGFYEWADQLERIGTLGVFHTDQLGNLDKLTKCTEHKLLGTSEDGVYTYYLSTNPDADKSLLDALGQIRTEITDIVLDEQESYTGSLGTFTTKDIYGTTYTNKLFQDYELTMVNVFTTWCTPCINEIPDLEKLYQEINTQGVNVVGIVLDAVDQSGNIVTESVEKANLLAERADVSYPFLIPDAGFFNGRLADIEAVPETFFVDANGNIVGDTYSGSHSLEQWSDIVKTERERQKGEQP